MTYKELIEKLQTLTPEQLEQDAKVSHGTLLIIGVETPDIKSNVWLDTTDDWRSNLI